MSGVKHSTNLPQAPYPAYLTTIINNIIYLFWNLHVNSYEITHYIVPRSKKLDILALS